MQHTRHRSLFVPDGTNTSGEEEVKRWGVVQYTFGVKKPRVEKKSPVPFGVLLAPHRSLHLLYTFGVSHSLFYIFFTRGVYNLRTLRETLRWYASKMRKGLSLVIEFAFSEGVGDAPDVTCVACKNEVVGRGALVRSKKDGTWGGVEQGGKAVGG